MMFAFKDILRAVCSLALALIVVAGANATESAGLDSEQRAAIDTLVGRAMAANDVPGLTAAVALNGKLVWSEAYGMADVENFVPATTHTLIRTASISKWLTATAAMRLVEEGKLDLDAPPQRYCRAYPRKQWPMTVRQVLNHTSGIRHYHGSNGEPRDTPEQRQALDELERQENLAARIRYTDRTTPLDTFKNEPLLFEPGSRFNYTSLGYRLLGCVLEGASGESYPSLMKRTVFGPAAMLETTQDDSWAIIAHRASGYATGEDGRLRRAEFRDTSENVPAGGHLSTAEDLVRFAVAFNAGALVKAQTIQVMSEQPPTPGSDRNKYYGLGIMVRTVPQGLLLSHTGGQRGATTCLQLLPDTGFAVAIMANRQRAPIPKLCDDVRDLLARSHQEGGIS